MSQMLVRIDKETDKALTYLYDNNGILGLNQFAVMATILARLMLMGKK